ncbi:M20/M25/M40 family metallo-hydrolase [Algisphaera agarilytica]|uniref:Acetylornithine deacetylase n=1 Tax=Algisphaera agarilytica TaxID=1385975 RepID=A0A7X0LL77_9BACT|nr:M20/M25/M40 family metallo-hydrolase [Algisphaera agarilytica]MBB6431220.1 acetylornithine deacetylase [Algisphaera agarilytica]
MADPVPQSVVELLQLMVRVNTVNRALPGSVGGEAALVEALESLADAWGLATTRLPVKGQADQLLVTHVVGDDLPWILFDSHLDTVAVEGMTIDPFSGDVGDGKVWGRGSCDTKGTGAAMLWAMKQAVAGQGDRALPHNLALLFSVDEEVSMQGVASFVKNDLPSLGWWPAAVIVGEPTEHRPVIAHNGCLRWTLTTHGKACHSSVPHEGVSAISAMVRVIDLIESRYIPSLSAEHPLTGTAVCSINMIRGGSAPNIIPDRCTIQIDRRVVPGEDSAQAIADIHALLEPLGDSHPPIDFTQDVVVDHPPFGTEHNGALIDHLVPVLESLGLPKLTLGAPFATHASYFDQAGIPAVVLGPGSPHTAHTKDEWVAVDQIERGVEVYRAIMQTPLAAISS